MKAPASVRACAGAVRAFARDHRGSASIEMGLGVVVLLVASVLCFDLYARVKANTSATRLAATMADYLARETAPDAAQLRALGAYLRKHELVVPAHLVYVLTALRQPAGDPLPAVQVLWTDATIRIGPATVTAELAGAVECGTYVDGHGNADLPAGTIAVGEVVVVAEVCARLTREGSISGRFIAGDIFRRHLLPVRNPDEPPVAPA